ncbi:hypothetical protein Tco_0705417 [Tanacetum coccineum]|uniref:Retrotransposon gag protein n=1 Tax=Tanacetum coccineum TaxID=301880 RepID=A0ABQ4Y5F3_9ASTR
MVKLRKEKIEKGRTGITLIRSLPQESCKNLTKSPREIITTKEVGKMLTKPPKMLSKARDTSKYYEFHQDYGHNTNACRELKIQIEEAVKSTKLAHLVKGIRKGKAQKKESQPEEWAPPTVKAEPITDGKEEPILMVGVVNNPLKRKEPPKIMSVEEMIFPSIRNRDPSVDPILISVQVYGRQVGRVLLEELSLQNWESLPFYNALANPVASQKQGPRVIMSEYRDIRRCEQVKRLKELLSEAPLEVFKCIYPEEKVIVNHRYPENPKNTEDIKRDLCHGTQAKQRKKDHTCATKEKRDSPQRSAAASKEVEELKNPKSSEKQDIKHG